MIIETIIGLLAITIICALGIIWNNLFWRVYDILAKRNGWINRPDINFAKYMGSVAMILLIIGVLVLAHSIGYLLTNF